MKEPENTIPPDLSAQKSAAKYAKIGMVLGVTSVISCLLYLLGAIFIIPDLPISAPDKSTIGLFALIGPLMFLPALWCVYIASKSPDEESAPHKIIGLYSSLIGLLLNVVMTPVFLVIVGGYSESACKISCTSSLKQIGLSLRMYSHQYNEQFPNYDGAKGLDLLRSSGILENPYVYKCPSTATFVAETGEPITGNNCDYIFIGGLSEASSVDQPIAMDKPENHKGYLNVLFVDGHVKGYNTKEWEAYKKEYGIKIPIKTVK